MTQEEIERIAKDLYPLENQLMERIAYKRGYGESFEKQKLEFAIEQLKSIRAVEGTDITYVEVNDKIKELEQKLKEYEI